MRTYTKNTRRESASKDGSWTPFVTEARLGAFEARVGTKREIRNVVFLLSDALSRGFNLRVAPIAVTL